MSHPTGTPVTQQPIAMSMLNTQGSTRIPIGPEASYNYLRNITRLHIKQKIEVVEIITGFETANKFTIFDDQDQTVFYAVESSNCLVRQCCGPARPFAMKILDIQKNEVMRIDRPLACQCCLCFCCLMNVDVSCPRGNVVGKVQQEFSCLFPKFTVENAVGEKALNIDGPFWTCSCGGDITFNISNIEGGTKVGDITKNWSGFCQEYCTDADNFTLNFDRNLDPSIKASLLGAVFLIVSTFYNHIVYNLPKAIFGLQIMELWFRNKIPLSGRM